jgi:hypothetical protein
LLPWGIRHRSGWNIKAAVCERYGLPDDAYIERARPGAAIAVVAAARGRIEAAERHLRTMIELGDRLNST